MHRIGNMAAAALCAIAAPATAATTIDFDSVAVGNYGPSLRIGQVTFVAAEDIAIREYLDPDGVTRKRICAWANQSCQFGLAGIFDAPVANLSMTLASVGEDYERVISSVALLSNQQTATDNFRLPPFNALYTLSFGTMGDIAAFTFYAPAPLTLTVGNIRFDAAGAVPEPATWAMMIAGFGLVGAGLRRRLVVARIA